ncbi:MAG: ribonuclease III [Neisseria sp.]|nr:ribonuclease III [Neisseria sp.]
MSIGKLRSQQAVARLQQRIAYTFRQPELLRQALTHRSFSAKNNERFEFVGDAILNYTVAKMLFDAFPELSEGELSRLRANLVNQDVLAQIAQELSVGDALFLGAGELKSGGFNRPSILADAMEALFAAVSFDADFARAEKLVRQLFAERIRLPDATNQGKDAKTLLQETLQHLRLALPKYRIISQSGEAHQQTFEVQCDLGELGFQSQAQASSRRAAEQIAAEEALQFLRQRFPNHPPKKHTQKT